MKEALRHPAFLRACLVALLLNVLLWAFLAYLEPAFHGESASRLLFCY
jgi:hypothetical protein